MKKLVVLISGNGSNLQAILEACEANILKAKVVLVISDRASAKGLERAQKFNIPTLVKPRSAFQESIDYEHDLVESIKPYQADWIILAGWMRILTQVFLNSFPQRVINLHPALPGAFPGMKAIERAFSAYQQGEISHTGVMVHLVPDEGIDSGPVLGKIIVPIYKEDTLDILTVRMHEAEHQLLIKALQWVIKNNYIK